MGWIFRKQIRLARGVSINLGRTGVSVTVGVPGYHITLGQRGATQTMSLPGTGISHRKRLWASSKPNPGRPLAPAQQPLSVPIPPPAAGGPQATAPVSSYVFTWDAVVLVLGATVGLGIGIAWRWL